jgi:hypothetical protein
LIFAELQYERGHRDIHGDLDALLRTSFENVRSGLQGDSWFCVLDGGETVFVDTFTAFKHQVKSPSAGAHVQAVIEVLRSEYEMQMHNPPRPEDHEDE